MFRLRASITAIAITVMLLASVAKPADWSVGLESGTVFSGYNDIRIPNASGTGISLSDDLSTDTKLYTRLTVQYQLGKKHTAMILFAPLSLRANGRVGKEVLFNTVLFPGDSEFKALYKFNSYRLTYRYRLHESDRLTFGFGFTAKIRDAAVVLEAGGVREEYTNIGFVPLLNFRLEYAASDRLSTVLEGDALAAPQGRAEDVSAMIYYRLSKSLRLKAGYRVLEGGADVDDVYSFALLHYAAVGLQIDI